MEGRISLVEAIEDLRHDLAEAQAAAEGSKVGFRLREVSLSLEVTLGRQASEEGRVGFWVIEGTGRLQHDEATIHRVTLTLAPTGEDGDELIVRSKRFDRDRPGAER